MSDTTTASLRRDEFWQPRVDLTIVGRQWKREHRSRRI